MNRIIVICCLVSFSFFAKAQLSPLKITDTGYLASPEFSVLVFHSNYPVGKQGYIEFIQYDNRNATNGNFFFHEKMAKTADPNDPDVLHEPIPKIEKPGRILNKEENQISVPFSYDKINLKYSIDLIPAASGGIRIQVNLKEKPDLSKIDNAYFKMEFFPPDYQGKGFYSENQSGVFPETYNGSYFEGKDREEAILCRGKKLVLAPEDPKVSMTIQSKLNDITLYDDRKNAQIFWFAVETKADFTQDKTIIDLEFQPAQIKNWQKEPLFLYSRTGYHPAQEKVALLEMDSRISSVKNVELQKFNPDTGFETVLKIDADDRGNFLRYRYFGFDFSNINEEGLYRLKFGDLITDVFRIGNDVFMDKMWQPTLETFIPVQMCHMRVLDRGHIWHGACHLDDGVQAPAPINLFDGFYQTADTESDYKPYQHIPYFDKGGWHDAGDDDVNTASSGKTTYHLALVAETFGIQPDQTSVDFAGRVVRLHRPDGKSDLLQQVSHGADFLLGQYDAIGHSITGVISPKWEIYALNGDWASFSDNKIDEGEPKDDRLVFTNKDSGREYLCAAIFSAAARVLKNTEPEKAQRCSDWAQKIWETESKLELVSFRSVGTPRSLTGEQTNAAVELYLLTKEKTYLDWITENREKILKPIKETGWTITRVIDDINDESFKRDYETALKSYSKQKAEKLAESPFGVEFSRQVWGIGWNLLWDMQKHYYLIKKYPGLFPKEQLLDAVEFQVGRHPGSNKTFVSGVGNHKPLPSFGINRADYSYIPGGHYSGSCIVAPDFFELKEDHPHLWQQSEYIVFGGSAWIFCVLAANDLLN